MGFWKNWLNMSWFLVQIIVHKENTKTVKIFFLILSEGLTDVINNSVGEAGKRISISFTKSKLKFCFEFTLQWWGCYVYINRTQICKFKSPDNIPAYQFCLVCVSKDFTNNESISVSVNGVLYYFEI